MSGAFICPNCKRQSADTVCPDDGFKTVPLANVDLDEDPLVGHVFEGRYQIDDIIGRGGFGAVYRATQLGMNRAVAIKLLAADLGRNLNEIARFQQEARVLANLNHPGVTHVYDFGQSSDGRLYLVMEFLDGVSLEHYLRDVSALSPEETIEVGVQVCDALAEAHHAGIIHRDLKPGNLFFARGSRGKTVLKVLDFGIARVSDSAGQRLTQTGVVIGSPPYMSPEQCSGQPLSPQSDLYSLGCVLYECLAGHTVFQRTNHMGHLVAHVHDEPPPLTHEGATVTGPLVDVIMQLLAKLPEERPASADRVRAMLDEARTEPLIGANLPRVTGAARAPRSKLDLARASSRLDINPPRVDSDGLPKIKADKSESASRRAATPPEPVASEAFVSTGLAARSSSRKVGRAPPRRSVMPYVIGGVLGAAALVVAVVVMSGGSKTHVDTDAGEAVIRVAAEDASADARSEEDAKVASVPPATKVASSEDTNVAPEVAVDSATSIAAAAPDGVEPDRVEADTAPADVFAVASMHRVMLVAEPVAMVAREGHEPASTPLEVTWQGDVAPTVRLTARGYLPMSLTLPSDVGLGADAAPYEVKLKRVKPTSTTPRPEW